MTAIMFVLVSSQIKPTPLFQLLGQAMSRIAEPPIDHTPYSLSPPAQPPGCCGASTESSAEAEL